MASHHSHDEYEEVSNDFSLYHNDAKGAIDEILNESKMLYEMVSTQKKQILSLEKKLTLWKNILKLKIKLYWKK